MEYRLEKIASDGYKLFTCINKKTKNCRSWLKMYDDMRVEVSAHSSSCKKLKKSSDTFEINNESFDENSNKISSPKTNNSTESLNLSSISINSVSSFNISSTKKISKICKLITKSIQRRFFKALKYVNSIQYLDIRYKSDLNNLIEWAYKPNFDNWNEKMTQMVYDNENIIVYSRNQTVGGYTIQRRKKNFYVVLLFIGVTIQNKGYGKAMIKNIQQSCERILCWADEGAVGFYIKCGFVKIDVKNADKLLPYEDYSQLMMLGFSEEEQKEYKMTIVN